MLKDTPTEAPEEVPSDEEEEFRHEYRQNLINEAGPVGRDIKFKWDDPTEQAFTFDIVEEYYYKVRKVKTFPYNEQTHSWVDQVEQCKAESVEEPEQSNLSALEEKGNLKYRGSETLVNRGCFLSLRKLEAGVAQNLMVVTWKIVRMKKQPRLTNVFRPPPKLKLAPAVKVKRSTRSLMT